MYFKFTNETGSIIFGTDKRSDSIFRLTAAEGLSIPEKNFTAAVYANLRGQETVGTYICPRTITISGDVLITKGSVNILSEAAHILDKPGSLEVHFDEKRTRKIDCTCSSFVPGEKRGRYTLYVIQFICDDPYFYDTDCTEAEAFGVQPLINSTFSFPGVFSTRVTRSNIYCEGNANTEPIFKISVTEKNESDSPELCITNHTTGCSINLQYSAEVGDVITIDTAKRKIYNQNNENLLEFLADDSFFDDFYLVPGENDIGITVSGTVDAVRVACLYYARYIEAVL